MRGGGERAGSSSGTHESSLTFFVLLLAVISYLSNESTNNKCQKNVSWWWLLVIGFRRWIMKNARTDLEVRSLPLLYHFLLPRAFCFSFWVRTKKTKYSSSGVLACCWWEIFFFVWEFIFLSSVFSKSVLHRRSKGRLLFYCECKFRSKTPHINAPGY